MTNSVNTAIPILEARALSCNFDSIRALDHVDSDVRSGEVEALTGDTGLRQASKQGKASLVGFDAKPCQLVELKAGTVQSRVAQQSAQIGVQGVAQAIDALNGTKTTKVIQAGEAIITLKNFATVGKEYAYESKCSRGNFGSQCAGPFWIFSEGTPHCPPSKRVRDQRRGKACNF